MRIILLILLVIPMLFFMGFIFLDLIDEYRKISRGSKRRTIKRDYNNEKELRRKGLRVAK